MFNLDHVTTKNDNKSWPYRMLIIGPSGKDKNNVILNLIQQDNNIIDKIYFYAKDLEEQKYQLLTKKREEAGIKNLNDFSAFIEHSNFTDDICDKVNDYNPKEKKNIDCV